jgi:hypothetical protein
MGPSGSLCSGVSPDLLPTCLMHPTDLVTGQPSAGLGRALGYILVTILALRLLKDNIDAGNKGQICFHLRARVGRHEDVTISGSSATHVPDSASSRVGSLHIVVVSRKQVPTYGGRQRWPTIADTAFTREQQDQADNLHATPSSTTSILGRKLPPCSSADFHNCSIPTLPVSSCAA